MTTIDLYKKHKAGEVSREKFLYEVRCDAQLPWIISVTSYDDAIKILKNKGIITETKIEELSPDTKFSAYNKASSKFFTAMDKKDPLEKSKRLSQSKTFGSTLDPTTKSKIKSIIGRLDYEIELFKANSDTIVLKVKSPNDNKQIAHIVVTKDKYEIQDDSDFDNNMGRKLKTAIKYVQDHELANALNTPVDEKLNPMSDEDIEIYVDELGEEVDKKVLGKFFAENNLYEREEDALLKHYGFYNNVDNVMDVLRYKDQYKSRRRAFAENKENIPVSKEQKIQVIKEWIWYCFEEGTDKESIQKWNKKIDNYFADKDDVTFSDFKNIWNEMTYEIGVGDVGADSEGFGQTWGDIQKGILNNPEKTYESLQEGKKKQPKAIDADHANPYQYRLGIQYELECSDDYTDEGLDKAKAKTLRNLTKDSNYYTTLLNADKSHYTFKATETDKPGMQAKADGYLKKELVKNAKANVKDNLGKKEQGTASPKGVKEMTMTPKKAKGISKVMDIPGKPKVVKEGVSFKDFFLTENEEVEVDKKAKSIAKIKAKLKKETKAIIVPKIATGTQVDQIVKKEIPAAKPGETIDIIRK